MDEGYAELINFGVYIAFLFIIVGVLVWVHKKRQ